MFRCTLRFIAYHVFSMIEMSKQLGLKPSDIVIQVHSVSFETAKLGVKSAFVRLPAPPLPWEHNNTAAAGADGNGAAANHADQESSLAEAVETAEPVPDAGGVKVDGGHQLMTGVLDTQLRPVQCDAASSLCLHLSEWQATFDHRSFKLKSAC